MQLDCLTLSAKVFAAPACDERYQQWQLHSLNVYAAMFVSIYDISNNIDEIVHISHPGLVTVTDCT